MDWLKSKNEKKTGRVYGSKARERKGEREEERKRIMGKARANNNQTRKKRVNT